MSPILRLQLMSSESMRPRAAATAAAAPAAESGQALCTLRRLTRTCGSASVAAMSASAVPRRSTVYEGH